MPEPEGGWGRGSKAPAIDSHRAVTLRMINSENSFLQEITVCAESIKGWLQKGRADLGRMESYTPTTESRIYQVEEGSQPSHLLCQSGNQSVLLDGL